MEEVPLLDSRPACPFMKPEIQLGLERSREEEGGAEGMSHTGQL